MTTNVSVANEVQRLSQTKNLQQLTAAVPVTELITVHLTDRTDSHLYYIDCALVPNSTVEQCLTKATYDLRPDGGKPEASCYYGKNGEKKVVYHRFGNNEGFEPLIISRSFYNLKQDYLEISEEFRLFHNLFHDKDTDQYFKLDDSGNEALIAIIEPHRVRIRLLEIRQFLAIKDMHLSIQFDWREQSPSTLEELGLVATAPNDTRQGLTFWGLNYGDVGMRGCRAFSRLLGKTLIRPLPKEKSGFWGFANEPAKTYAEFIIALDEDGESISCSSNPAEFYKHPRKPDYLTPIDFKKSVLDKYYQQPSKYKVEDGYLRCGTLWGLMMDNHHADKVTVWLGDLGRDLPESEHLHWKAHNIPPKGGPSETFFRRQILAQFADSDRAEHNFVHAYESLNDASSKTGAFRFLVPLAAEDEHHLISLRIPATDEQKEFDELILSLTKVLIDYLNEKDLRKLLNPDNTERLEPGSINLLERVFIDQQIDGSKEHIAFLRQLQELRSKGSAHRKGKEYKKLVGALKADKRSLRALVEGLLRDGTNFVEYLQAIVESGKISASRPKN